MERHPNPEMSSPGKSRPYVLVLCHALTGHITPLLSVTGALLERGWTVGFLGPTTHRSRIESAGAEFFQLRGMADLDDSISLSLNPPVPDYNKLPWHERALVDTRVQCLDTVPDQWASIKEALVALHSRESGRQVIVICEAFVFGILPLKCGAPLPDGVPVPRSVCVSVTPPMIRTKSQPPFGFPYPYDPSPAGVARNAAIWEAWIPLSKPLTDHLDAKIMEAGGSRGTGMPFLSGANYTCHEAILQIGLPSLEYPRDDWPSGFGFIGIIPPKAGGTAAEETKGIPWWSEFVANAELPRTNPARKTVILVTQGTVEVDASDLIVPTMRAVSGLDQVVLVVILGRRGGELPAGVEVPANVRVIDYLRYGAVLPHTDLWVQNAGYGAVTQAIAAGIPMIVAGETQEKPENARRVAWSGIGINLKTARPSVDQVKEAILEVLQDGKYRKRVLAMQKEMEGWSFTDLVEKQVAKLVE